MLSISPPIKGAGHGQYYLKLAAEDYYSSGQEQPGRWFGRGSHILNLSGKVDDRSFLNLLAGLSPDGNVRLVQNAGRSDRQTAWDLTFSAPKSVSVFWAVAPESIGMKAEQAHQRAVETALQFVENTAGYSRTGKAGATAVQAALTFACFQHSTSRAQDPQLHTHALLVNVGVRSDGTTGTLLSKPVFERKMLAGALYQVELARNLRTMLGLSIHPEKVGFHIEGVPKELCDAFSKRRFQIKEALDRRGVNSAVAAKIATLATRSQKQTVLRPALFREWRAAASERGWTPAHAQNLIRQVDRFKTDEKLMTARLRDAANLVSGQARSDLRILGFARTLAIEHGLGAEGMARVLAAMPPCVSKWGARVEWKRLLNRQPWVPPKRQWLRLEKQALLPHAGIKALQKLQLPVVAAEIPMLRIGKPKTFKPKWWGMRWKKEAVIGELRVQDRLLFPKAPKWSPFHQLSLPAMRLTPKRSNWEPEKQQQRKLNKYQASH